MRYAQIDANGLCFAESILSSEVDSEFLIPLDASESAIGMYWDGMQWVESLGLQLMPEVVITNMTVSNDPLGLSRFSDDFTSVRMPVGASVSIDAELRLDGDIVESFNSDFAMPMKSTDGFMRFINVQFIDGKTTFSPTMLDSKRWEVTQYLINSGLPEDHHMRFAGIVITAVE